MDFLKSLATDSKDLSLDSITGAFQGSYQNYLLAFLAILLSFFLRRVITDIVIGRLTKLTKGTENKFDDLVIEALERPLSWSTVLLGFYLAVQALHLEFGETLSSALSDDTAATFTKILSVAWILMLGWLGLNLCDVIGHGIELVTKKTENRLDDMLVPIVRRSLKMFVGLIAFIFAIQNLGYSISALLAGFSVGGVALALASKDTLQNFFGSIMIFVDRPFQVGDWIVAGTSEGVVEEVGFRSTRIRTFSRTLITVPNSKIAHDPINNYSRMEKRRIKLRLGIAYGTEAARIQAAVNAIRHLLKNDERVHQDFWLVNFDEFGNSSLNILVYFFTKTTDWATFMQHQQEIGLGIIGALETLGVELVRPTQTINLRQDPGPGEPPPLEEVLKVACPDGMKYPVPEGENESESSADENDEG
ncbi:MAG: mechanosensitive ion channel family protein [Planctomycetota bacterium]|nr:mechanosensitive ion channel family protein [Planctomycetota bacterium]